MSQPHERVTIMQGVRLYHIMRNSRPKLIANHVCVVVVAAVAVVVVAAAAAVVVVVDFVDLSRALIPSCVYWIRIC